MEKLNRWLRNQRWSFWKITVIAALVSILVYKLTGNTSIGQLLFLIVFIVASVKVLLVILRISSLFLKVVVFTFIMLAWMGIVFGH